MGCAADCGVEASQFNVMVVLQGDFAEAHSPRMSGAALQARVTWVTPPVNSKDPSQTPVELEGPFSNPC